MLTDDQLSEVIWELDEIARDACVYEYGLPMLHPEKMDAMRGVLRKLVGGYQARIDALMLEYCPDEMTPEQLEEWAKHQKASQLPPEELAAIKASIAKEN